MFLAVAVPPGQVGDEPAHLARAAGLLNGDVMARRTKFKGNEVVEVDVNYAIFRLSFGQVTQIDGRPVETLADYYQLRNRRQPDTVSTAVIDNTGIYFPAAYLPAAFALATGLALKLSPFLCFMLARFCMLMTCLALGCLSLCLAAYGEAVLLAVLLMPMTLGLAGSISQDGILIGLACFAAATLSRADMRWPALPALTLILLAKLPYLPLACLALLPLARPSFGRRLAQTLAVAAPALIWGALIAAFVAVPMTRDPYHPGPLLPGGANVTLTLIQPSVNLHIVLAHPVLFLHSLAGLLTVTLLHEMIGILGWMNLAFTPGFYLAWTVALAAALLGLAGAQRRHPPPSSHWLQPALVVALLVAAYTLIGLSMYLTWTHEGDVAIDGMQGRYLLVLLPFLLLAAQLWPGWRLPAIVPALPVLGLGVYDLGYVPLKIISFYYMY